MFLKNLIIQKGDEIIRNLEFHSGVNLIIDETKTDDKKESGNNVGKTTVLRLIDFCLGGDGVNIYQDKEFKYKTNTQIESFLKENNVTIILTLKEKLDVDSSKEIIIKRNFLKRKSKVQQINGESYNDHEFPKKLKEIIFASTSEKPTFRQIISKNIRDEKNRLNNTLKVLNSFTSLEEYEALYLFWFGIELDQSARKQAVLREKSAEESVLTNLKKEHSLSEIKQSLLVINSSIRELENKKHTLSSNKNYESQVDDLNQIKYEINRLSTELGRLDFRKNLIEESKTDLESEFSNIDTEHVRKIYEEAKALVPTLQKTFNETLSFHNQMVKEKIKYITQEIPELETKIAALKKQLAALLKTESTLLSELNKKGVFEGLETIFSELKTAYEKKGRFEELKSMWITSASKLEEINTELDLINESIGSSDYILQEKIATFNKFFSRMSQQLYGESFVLSTDIGKGGYELNISSISGNLGTGKKKGQIAAFDLSYIEFADAEKIKCLHFVLHDQIENVHDNQISLLIEITNNLNCQLVIPILRDKLPQDVDVKKLEVVSLSQSNKLFKIP